MSNNNNGWTEWSKHVILELERLDKCVSNIKKEISELRVQLAEMNKDLEDLPNLIKNVKSEVSSLHNRLSGDAVEIGKLQVKAGIWGLFGGLIPILIALLVRYLSKGG